MARPKGSKNKRRGRKAKGSEVSEAQLVEEIREGISELKSAYRENLLAIRGDLIRAIAEIRNLKKHRAVESLLETEPT